MTELILALDVTERARAVSIARACAPYLDAIKIGYPLVLAAGLGLAREIGEFRLPLIADFKVADIPNTNRLITDLVFSAGFSAVICHGFTGRDAVQACVENSHLHGGLCYVVAEMSHPGATEFFHGGVAEKLTQVAIACKADGIIAPATRPERAKKLRSIIGQKKIYAPGVGAQGGDIRAVAGIVDGIIVGRAIYEADSPATASKDFARICKM
ncbi:MAG: orotidine-5'-phosphate decarboxylase [Methanoregula sp.]|jgi:orotidine-5'-phosphate decarboxylase|nr:orotidine-5'-phosphate decarboxylase [Methanoregula sp.]